MEEDMVGVDAEDRETESGEFNEDEQVFLRAHRRGQETFTLVAQDRSAPRTILYWIGENFETAPPEKLRDAFERALRMREYSPRKWAD
jgi:hypothetical protein